MVGPPLRELGRRVAGVSGSRLARPRQLRLGLVPADPAPQFRVLAGASYSVARGRKRDAHVGQFCIGPAAGGTTGPDMTLTSTRALSPPLSRCGSVSD